MGPRFGVVNSDGLTREAVIVIARAQVGGVRELEVGKERRWEESGSERERARVRELRGCWV